MRSDGVLNSEKQTVRCFFKKRALMTLIKQFFNRQKMSFYVVECSISMYCAMFGI